MERYAHEYLEIFIKDVLYCLINDEEVFYLPDEFKAPIIEIWNKFLEKDKLIFAE